MKNDTVAIYCKQYHKKLIPYIKESYKNLLVLYDTIGSQNNYSLPQFHYTEINNLGYDIIIDDLTLYERLKNKNNKIIYYISDMSNSNINWRRLVSVIQSVDSVIIPGGVPDKFMKIMFNYTKEIFYV